VHHFSHTWLDAAVPEGDLMELNGWTSSALGPTRSSQDGSQPRGLGNPVAEGAGDGGGATGHVQLLVNVLQVGAAP
jgi:hypothetical protein